MPAKKDVPRLKATTPEELRNTAKRLRKAASAITGLASSMELKGLDSADVEGHKSVDLAFDALKKYVANCEKKIGGF